MSKRSCLGPSFISSHVAMVSIEEMPTSRRAYQVGLSENEEMILMMIALQAHLFARDQERRNEHARRMLDMQPDVRKMSTRTYKVHHVQGMWNAQSFRATRDLGGREAGLQEMRYRSYR